jgi:tight adherence protein C
MFNSEMIFYLGQLLLFAAVVLIFYSAWGIFYTRAEILRRVKENKADMAVHSAGDPGLALDNSVLKGYKKYLIPDSEKKLNTVRNLLLQAGYRGISSVRLFYASRIVLSAAAFLISVIVIMPVMDEMPAYITALTMLLMVLIGFFLPWFWVERTRQYRKMQIQDSFADVLDLLLVCIEAGHGFDQALSRIVKELETSNPVVTDELLVITRELRAGKERYQVLGDFAERTGVDDIKSFITVIKQADKFGVSIAQALRVYSHEMRDKRYTRAEEKANMLPMKLALGAILFTVPPAIIIMVGPSIIMVIQNLGTLV